VPSSRTRPRIRRLGGAWALCAAAVALLPAAGLAKDDFKEQRKRYRAYLERPSLYMRHRGRVRFAATGDPRALATLIKSYARPEEPKDQVRYLLAAICADAFRDASHAPAFEAWRKRNVRARDAWLWYRALDLEHEVRGPDGLLAVARSGRPGVFRAAAMQVLAQRRDEAVVPLAAEVLADLPTSAFDRARLVEAAATALFWRQALRKTDAWQAAAESLFQAMDAKGTEDRTRLVLARRFAKIYRTDTLYLRGAAWRALQAGEDPPPPSEADVRYAVPERPRFLGLEGTGSRIAYVIDASDSMLTPLTDAEIDDLKRKPPPVPGLRPGAKPKGPITGGGAPKRPRGPKPKPAPPVREDDPQAMDLDWGRIRTRFDAARAFLKLSLKGLDPHQSFCVILFGSEAQPMRSTPGLRQASPENVSKAIGELDAIVPGPKTEGRPYGTLRGYTNLHGGLRRAFMVTERGLVKRPEYVEPILFERGCDTIFLLSDGRPTWDDWPAVDTLEREDDTGDPESGAEVEQKKTGHFYGPYALDTWLLDDVRRLNLFRKVEIHCVGLGEHDPKLLAWLARTGIGRFRRVGKEPK
jgi:hypothetical protein